MFMKFWSALIFTSPTISANVTVLVAVIMYGRFSMKSSVRKNPGMNFLGARNFSTSTLSPDAITA